MKNNELIKKLRKFTDEKDPLYTVKLRDLIINCSNEDIKREYYSVLDNTNNSIKVRFAAYYAIFIFYRRYDHHSLLYTLVEEYSNNFSDYKLNDVVWSQYYKFRYMDTNDEFSIVNAIKYAKKAVDNLGDNAGVLQNYAELVATGLETGREDCNEYLTNAINCIDKAMLSIHNYPKHYCTKGRLLSWTGEYTAAKRHIRKAIDLEDSDSKDSLIRISQYNDYYIDIKTRESLKEFAEHMEAAQAMISDLNEQTKQNSISIFEKMDTIQARYLELLAFFSAIIALILTSLNIVSNYDDFNMVVGLIMVMGGVLVIAFVVLRCLIVFNKDNISWKRYLCIFISAILLITTGYIIGNPDLWRAIWNIK